MNTRIACAPKCSIEMDLSEMKLLSISKKKKGGCFLNNSLTEIAIGLRFSPFDRGEHSASFYIWLKNPVCKCDE
jgi:hypothetical protein